MNIALTLPAEELPPHRAFTVEDIYRRAKETLEIGPRHGVQERARAHRAALMGPRRHSAANPKRRH